MAVGPEFVIFFPKRSSQRCCRLSEYDSRLSLTELHVLAIFLVFLFFKLRMKFELQCWNM